MRKSLTVYDITTGQILHTHHILEYDDATTLDARAADIHQRVAARAKLPITQVEYTLKQLTDKRLNHVAAITFEDTTTHRHTVISDPIST